VALGEVSQLTPELITWGAGFSFFYLLIVGSLMGFVAFNWLLGHVPAAMVATYAYVNPLVAILVGWLLGGEEMTLAIVAGMAVILAGVALVRGGGVKGHHQEMAEVGNLESEIRNPKVGLSDKNSLATHLDSGSDLVRN
jgi:drug/metabolite transporter (DMT)-like permease